MVDYECIFYMNKRAKSLPFMAEKGPRTSNLATLPGRAP